MGHPPDLTSRSDLTIGDLFYNRLSNAGQIWMWTRQTNGHLVWKLLPFNYEREDGMRLSLTPRRRDPSWVSEKWAKTNLP